MAHVSQSLKDFGPLQHYSTFNFESALGMCWNHIDYSLISNHCMLIIIGSIVQSINGPNLIVSELTNNINILQSSTKQFNTANFNTSLKLFIHRLFSSKRQALSNEKSINENNAIRFGKKFELPDDHTVMNYLRTTHMLNYSLHRTYWKNNVKFSIHDYKSTAKNSDSCLLYKCDLSKVNCGFIAAIIRQSEQQCHIVIHTINISRQDSFTLKNKHVVNPFIFWGRLTDPPHRLIINIQDIIVKIAYNKQDEVFHLFQFPNTVEST